MPFNKKPGAVRRKYKNQPVHVDGIKFDSKMEARRYGELKMMARAGQITDLRPSPENPKKERFKWTFLAQAEGATVQFPVKKTWYTPDFTYRDQRGKLVVEDVKGAPPTDDYLFRKKVMLIVFNIEVQEIRYR
jgi:hypothetical protein